MASGCSLTRKSDPCVQAASSSATPAKMTSRASDTLLTSRVKGRLAQNKDVGASHVKVVSESGAVFLMGLVTRVEAEAAALTASTTSGAQRVVKVFEYLD